jgi:hypothetical protein
MTAKQKAAREKFKAVVKEAAKLRKKNPKLTQAQAVKQAFAISYSKKGKKLGSVSRQTGTSDKKRDEQRKAKKPGKRKSGPGAQRPYYYEYRKNRTDKPGSLTGTHKDTKSHNVNIRVVSGIEPKNMYVIRDQYENDIKVILEAINRIKNNLPNMDYTEKNRANRIIVHYKKVIIKIKKRLRDQNKLINELLK